MNTTITDSSIRNRKKLSYANFAERLTITIPTLWLGFVLSISFMEAWLKFQAEGVTQIIGLNIGRLVFSALNKVELLFLIVLTVSTFKTIWSDKNKIQRNILMLLISILLIQTFYLLPSLDQRATMIINGTSPSESHLHLFYVVLEIVKVVSLGFFSHNTLIILNEQY